MHCAWRTLMEGRTPRWLRKRPNSLRARFGTDGTMNATHGSDAFHTAMREIDFWTNPECPWWRPARVHSAPAKCQRPSWMTFGEEMKLSEEEEMQKKLAMCASDIPSTSSRCKTPTP